MVVITDEAATHDCSLVVIDGRPSDRATVIAVGPGRILKNGRNAPMSVKKGDRVMVGRYAGYRYELDSGPVRLVDINEIVAVI